MSFVAMHALRQSINRVAKCGVGETRHWNGLRPRISSDQEKDSRSETAICEPEMEIGTKFNGWQLVRRLL